jgi:SAM-dependent methyltransferase
MSALLAKALVLARGHARRLFGLSSDAVLPASRSNADVTRFEIPEIAPAFANAKREELIDTYWRSHPRFSFFKGTPPNAVILDIGTGTGGLAFWREYLEPRRSDIRLFGIDLAEPVSRSLYDRFAVVNLDNEFPFPEMAFDAVFASHVLEHVQDPAQIVHGIAARLGAGARAYVEMPSPTSKALPSAQVYRDRGWPMIISNFYDDATHRETLDLTELIRIGAAAGLRCVESGAISSPYLEDALIAKGLEWQDGEILLYGYWSKTRWAHYVVLEKPV